MIRAAIISLALGCGLAHADEEPKPAPPDASLEQLAMADAIAVWGERAGDALALIAAARIHAGFETRDADLGGQASGGEPSFKEPRDPDPAARLLAQAARMAGGDSALTALIEETRELFRRRGPVDGPHRATARVRGSGGRVTFVWAFEAGEIAQVYARGDGDTSLDLNVYDQAGERVCRDAGPGDRLFCQWAPARTGEFRIEVVNNGIVFNDFMIVTNRPARR
ncbi:MAG: hypothetical protein KIS81_03260 [Maricaulaceae bacterium]|nr:hypothetical protein [Maricaulaceae bacterium]